MGGVEGEQCRSAVASRGYWEEAAMGARVDGHNVGAGGERAAASDGQVAAVFIEDGQPAAFRRDVEPVRAGVVGQHVRVAADSMLVDDLPAVEIHGQEHRVAVAGDER